MKIAIQTSDNSLVACGLYLVEDFTLICTLDSISLVPLGGFIFGDVLIKNNISLGSLPLKSDDIILNKRNLLNSTFPSSYSGCCGPSDEILNVTTKNGFVFAREFSDCWFAHFIHIPSNKVSLFIISENDDSPEILVSTVCLDNKILIVDRAMGDDQCKVEEELRILSKERIEFELLEDESGSFSPPPFSIKSFDEIKSLLGEFSNNEGQWLFEKFKNV